jgi:hypothetical protein
MFKLSIICLCFFQSASAQSIVEDPAAKRQATPHAFCSQPKNDEGTGQQLRNVALDLTCQQLRIWTFPSKLGRKDAFAPTIAVAGVAASLLGTDKSTAGYFRTTEKFRSFDSVFSMANTKYGLVALPFAFYGASLLRHDSYGQKTAILAGEALLDAEVVTKSLKLATGRVGPGSGTGFGQSRGNWLATTGGSFPSGHSAAAFAVATVFAQRYSHHKWIPWVAYAGATAVAFSTISQSGHFPSEAFLGSTIGFSISRFVVLR